MTRCALAFLLCTLTAGAEPRIVRIGVGEGLPTPYPRDVVRSPNGVLWAPMMASQGTARVGLVRVEGPEVTWLHGPGRGLTTDGVNAVAADTAGAVWVATDKGLFRTDATGPARFAVVSEPVLLRDVAAVPGGGAWAIGEPAGSRQLTMANAGRSSVARLPDACTRSVGLFPTGLEAGVVVCEAALVRMTGGAASRIATAGTAVEIPKAPRATSSERRQPLVWLYGAAATPDGVWLIGHTKRLTRLGADGILSVADGHFSELARGPSTTAVVADFDGGIFHLVGGALQPLAHGPGAVGKMWADGAAVWAVVAPRDAPARVERLPLAATVPKVLAWPLGETGSRPSPGVVGMTGDGQGGVWLATNEGLWHLVE